jgi:hypothetical protein
MKDQTWHLIINNKYSTTHFRKGNTIYGQTNSDHIRSSCSMEARRYSWHNKWLRALRNEQDMIIRMHIQISVSHGEAKSLEPTIRGSYCGLPEKFFRHYRVIVVRNIARKTYYSNM